MITIEELIENDRLKEEYSMQKIADKLKILKSNNHVNDIIIYHNELISLLNSQIEVIAEQKKVQWKITNYNLLIDAVLITSINYLSYISNNFRMMYLIFISICILVISIIATLMLKKTNWDLSYYRKCNKEYKYLLNQITGLHIAVEQQIINTNKDLRKIIDDEASEKENKMYFSIWFYAIIWIGFIISTLIIISNLHTN